MMFQLPELGLLSLAMTIPLISGGLNLAIIATANQAALLMAWILTTQMPGPEDISELNAMIAAHETVFNDPVGFRILDSRFHEKLSVIGGNAILQRIAYGLYNLGLDIRRRATAEPGVIAQSTKDHTRIVEAISARDQTRAGEAMKTHLANIEASTRRFALCAPPPIQKRQSV
jgi:DNA-binding FadR family transcriptional regulator